MDWPELDGEWVELKSLQASCRRCAECVPPLIHTDPRVRPLFGRFKTWKNGALFVFEAPNPDDTFDRDKGYLTYDRETDPTGCFARELTEEELGLSPEFSQVTNSVLCLPARRGKKFPVKPMQWRLCEPRIRDQIQILDPAVIVPVGGKALEAARRIENHRYWAMSDAVARPVRWLGRWLFPVYHTGRLGRIARKEDEQRRDWRRLREFLNQQEVVVPPP